jgi:ArsR family transcriptional regulator
MEVMKEKLAVLKGLSDETRLRILILLTHQELCVCEIEASLNLSQAKVSRHLTVLRHAGLVRNRRRGTWIYYRLTPPRNEMEKILQKYLKNGFKDVSVVHTDLKKLKEILATGRATICKQRRAVKKR